MTMTYAGTGSSPGTIGTDLKHTARTTGLLYLAFFITGISGSMLVRGQLFVADDAQATLSNLMEHGSLARVGVVLELGIVLAQALTAVWFYRLFRGVDTLAAGALAAFGMVNAVAILGSAFVSYAFPDADPVTQLLTVPATIGEIWIMGYLTIVGIRDHARPDRESALLSRRES